MVEFDAKNRWLIDRDGNSSCNYANPGSCDPSVNLVVLSFVHPLRLLEGTNDDQTTNGRNTSKANRSMILRSRHWPRLSLPVASG